MIYSRNRWIFLLKNLTEFISKKGEKHMNEQEIVNYLKDNKTEGRIFLFMPEEVRKWCRKHYSSLHYYVYEDGIFESMNISNGDEICDNEIIGLPDEYEIEVPTVFLKFNLEELRILEHALNEGLDLDIFENKDIVFPVTDKVCHAILEIKYE